MNDNKGIMLNSLVESQASRDETPGILTFGKKDIKSWRERGWILGHLHKQTLGRTIEYMCYIWYINRAHIKRFPMLSQWRGFYPHCLLPLQRADPVLASCWAVGTK